MFTILISSEKSTPPPNAHSIVHTSLTSPREKKKGQFSIQSPRLSATENGGTEPYKAILGVGVPVPKPYIQLI